NDFNIKIICDREKVEDNKIENGKSKHIDRDKINGEVKNSILEILNIKTTQISVEINSEEIITKIIDRGTPIYHIKEKNKDFSLLTNAKIDLYFLNSSAKNNFTRKMGVQVVNFGSVFLFKNGFRVQPFGEVGDDSWGLDYRAQQGYNRFLGTRDLFGKVEMLTNNSDQFKEVSSRDGGLVETIGYHQLMNAFKEKGLVRLERYVVGVLWGEGFKKRKYFGEGNDANKLAESFRDKLKSDDKVSDNTSAVESNLGSKLDFIQIVKSLTTNKEIEVLNFNRDFVNLINERIDEYQTKFITDLETIAEQTNDEDLKEKILKIEKQYQELKREKEEAERKALEEEKKRIEAEEKAEKEEKARKEAERKAEKEEEKRRKAELATLKKEKERAEAEVAKLKAEKKAKEEEEKRKKEEEARIKAENEVTRRKEQITRYKSAETIEYKDLRDSNHIVGVYSDEISKKILLLKRKLDKGKTINNEILISFIQGISLANEKIATITRFTTKSNFLKASLETKEDIVSYISNYIEKTYKALYKIDIEILNRQVSFVKTFQPIELSVILDNILSNSRKKNAKKVIFEFKKINNDLEIKIRDIGDRLSESIENSDLIFEEGITTTKGSGLGLNHVKRIIEEDLNGTIEYNPKYKNGFELILIIKNEN
ncbi:MAG: ATP-binding protein, partial [Flavobacteriaceae bacterium]